MLRHVRPVPPKTAEGLLARVHAQVRAEWDGALAPLVLHDADPRLEAAAWALFREAHLTGAVPRHVKDVVAATTAHAVGCPFLLDVHARALDGAGHRQVADALWAHTPDAIGDPGLRLVASWCEKATVPGAPILQDPPFQPGVTTEMAATAVAAHYLARMVTVFVGSDRAGGGVRWFQRLTRRGARRDGDAAPGASLRLLPDVPLPDDLAWARPSPVLAGALARLAAATERVAHERIPVDAQAVVKSRVRHWRGGPPPSPGWTDHLVEELSAPDQALARLALLTALAPHQVNVATVNAVRRYFDRDADLLATAAWGSFLAARRVGAWVTDAAGKPGA